MQDKHIFRVMESDSGISEALSYSLMANKETWISQEIVQEFKDKSQATEFDSNGCDVILISVTKQQFYA